MRVTQPHAKTVFPWLTANLGKRALAPLTSTDARALMAAVQIFELYCYCEDKALLEAFGTVVRQMQSRIRYFAYHAIAHVRNWEDRPVIWAQAGLEMVHPPMCAFEPGGSARGGAQ